uniref:Uncharacterized protein n=1 Tax=Felis catus TaxID=9685 RepID=A0ABI8A378_FELCA
MSEVLKLQRKAQDLTQLLSSKDDLIKELRVKDSLLRKHQERVQRLKEELEAGSRELKRCKDENYELAMRLARQSEEKGAALMRTRDLQLEIERLKHSLMKAEDDCRVERRHTLKLRHAMEQRPSQELLWELQQEKALLQARVQELEAAAQEGTPDKSSPYIQVLEADWRQALREHQEKANTILSLRKDLRQGEALRARCVEEKEVFELQCLALRKDCEMYKDRIAAVLQQMEEVASERDQVGAVSHLPGRLRARARQGSLRVVWPPGQGVLGEGSCQSAFSSFLLSLVTYFERARVGEGQTGRERERERERERVSQAGSTLSAQSPMWGLNPRTVRSRPEPKSRVGCLTD